MCASGPVGFRFLAFLSMQQPLLRLPQLNRFEKGGAMEPLLLTVEEAAGQLGLGRTKVYELMASGALPAVKVDRCRRIRREDLLDFVAQLAYAGQPWS